jgi:hypothetical protein
MQDYCQNHIATQAIMQSGGDRICHIRFTKGNSRGMHQETLLSMDTMATIYYMSGLYRKAEDLWLELVTLYKKVYGTHHVILYGPRDI